MIEIPLVSGIENSHQEFSVQLGENLFEFTLDWNYLYNNWSVGIDIDGDRIVSGSVLAAGSCVNRHTTGIGKLYFIGIDATVENLGKQNQLVWISDPEKERKTAIPAQPSFCDGPKDQFYDCVLSALSVTPHQAYSFNDLLPSTVLADSGDSCTDGTLFPLKGLLESDGVVQHTDSKSLKILNDGASGDVFTAPDNSSSTTDSIIISIFIESESLSVGTYWSHQLEIGNTRIRIQSQQFSIKSDVTQLNVINTLYYNMRTYGVGPIHFLSVITPSNGGQSSTLSLYINAKLINEINIPDITIDQQSEIKYTKYHNTEIRIDQLYIYKSVLLSGSDVESIYLCGTGNPKMVITYESYNSFRFNEQTPDYWYKFNDPIGNVAIDSGKKGQNGTVTNFVTFGQPPVITQAGTTSALITGNSNLLFSAPLTGYSPNYSLNFELWIEPVTALGWALTFDFEFGSIGFGPNIISYFIQGDNGNDINGNFFTSFTAGNKYYLSATYTNYNDGSGMSLDISVNNVYVINESSPDYVMSLGNPGIGIYGSGDVKIDQLKINETDETSDVNNYRIGTGLLS